MKTDLWRLAPLAALVAGLMLAEAALFTHTLLPSLGSLVP